MPAKQFIKQIFPPFFSAFLRKFRNLTIGESKDKPQFVLNGCPLELPPDHALPSILAHNPHYESELVRLAEYLLKKTGRLVMIDVGANIGDTVASIPSQNQGMFLCVEGNMNFFHLLKKNLGDKSNINFEFAIVSDVDSNPKNYLFLGSAGTAHVVEDSKMVDTNKPIKTLDRIQSEYPNFSSVNLLKTDTDGYDFKVMRGGLNLLKGQHPAIHFELSFRDWKAYGETTWQQAAEYLSGLGYKQCLIYDNVGYLMAVDDFQASRLLPTLESYANRRHGFYVNLITFHELDLLWEEFKSFELNRRFD